MHILWKYLRPHRKLALLSLLLAGLSQVLALVDPIIFGILVSLNIQTSFNTPPMAMAAYYLKGVSPPHVKLTQIFGGSLPFVFLVFITMILVHLFPEIALWLPNKLYGN